MDLSLTDFKVQIIRQGGLFLAYSHTLGLSTTGKSETQALESFTNLAKIFVRDVKNAQDANPGVLDQLGQKLLQLGWTNKRTRWSPPLVK